MAEVGVLVTRPEGQGEALGALLTAQGYRPVYCPMLNIVPLDVPDAGQRELLLKLADFQHIICVSANAVRYGMNWIEDFWPQLPVDLQWYTIGDGSAAALAAYGITALQPLHELSSEGLLALPQLQPVGHQRILIIKGEGGRQLLRETLEGRGALLQELAVYRREVPRLAAGELAGIIRQGDCKALLLSSGEGLRNMVSLLNEEELSAVRKLVVVVPGNRVAQQALEHGFSEVVTAANATDGAMLDALQQHFASGG